MMAYELPIRANSYFYVMSLKVSHLQFQYFYILEGDICFGFFATRLHFMNLSLTCCLRPSLACSCVLRSIQSQGSLSHPWISSYENTTLIISRWDWWDLEFSNIWTSKDDLSCIKQSDETTVRWHVLTCEKLAVRCYGREFHIPYLSLLM